MNHLMKISIADADQNPVASIAFRQGTADERTIRTVMERRQYDISHLRRRDELRRIFHRSMENGRAPLIVDLGANIGVSALYFNHVWSGSKILAVQPAPDNFQLLNQNVRDKKNIYPIHAGISCQDGTLRIADENADTDAFRTIFGSGSIPAFSLPTLLRDHDGEPFICKIDIEGAEQDLFATNTDWINQFPLIMIELHDWMLCGAAASRNFLSAISQHQRDFIFYGETVFSIRC
jgi:FkbM family methyltransferase